MGTPEPMRQTSIRVPVEAVEALARAAARLGLSRDATLRELFAAHVTAMAERTPEQRLVHLTTLLRYPKRPLGRAEPDPRFHLRFRVSDTLRKVATLDPFLLPGQSVRHGHHDYSARCLTDAVMVALEMVEPIVIADLQGLPSTLTRREAAGLWRLTVAATLTPAERQALWDSGDDLLPEVLDGGEVGWHDRWRHEVAETLLRRIIDQEPVDRDEDWKMLTEQTAAFNRWLRDVQRRDPTTTYWLLRDLPEDVERLAGRGGAAVWRARRQLAAEALGRWAISPRRPPSFTMTPPGWDVYPPRDWRIAVYRRGQPLPATLTQQAQVGQVAVLQSGSWTAYWPLTEREQPVDGFAAVLAGGRGLDSARMLEVVGHQLDHPHVRVPADMACTLGFIDEAARVRLLSDGDRINQQRIAHALEEAEGQLGARQLADLRAAAGTPDTFDRQANRHRLRFTLAEPTWTWDVRSLPEAIAEGHDAARISWLTGKIASIVASMLAHDMQFAAMLAHDLGRHAHIDVLDLEGS